MAKMDDNALKAIVEAKLNDSLGWLGGALSKSRMLAQSYYRGDLFGNEQEGRSKIVSRDVAEAIDAAMPSLIKLFVTTDTVVIFSPRRPKDEEAAKQATDYVNWVWQTLPNSFDLLQTWIKSALMFKLGVVKSWWDDSEEVTSEEYRGLTSFQYMTLLSDDAVEVVKLATHGPEQQEIDPGEFLKQFQPGRQQTIQEPPNPMDDGMLYDCSIKRTRKRGKICVEAIPPEEFLTERRAVSLDPNVCGFAAHRCRRTVSDLIELGFDRKKVEKLPGADDLDFNQEVINRFRPEDEEPRRDADAMDPAMRPVWYSESYIKVDYDSDGVAEWRKVIMAGGGGYEILENIDGDGHPFSVWTPYKQPHKLEGESMADKALDIQFIKSTFVRQVADGMYFNNAPQLGVVEGGVNMEDALTRRPGGIIRMKAQGNVFPIPVQDMSASGFQMISYMDSVRETRTGIRRFTNGLQGDELNPYASTATGANLVEDASQDALMLIARNFAEMGLKPLFKRILELTCKYQDKKQTIRLRGKWVDIDPSTWTSEMDMTVTVGLGTGNKDRQVAQLLQMLTQVDVPIVQLQEGLEGPMLTMENVYNKIKKLTEAMGYKEADGFYTDPATAPPKPPKQQQEDPKVTAEKIKGQNALQVAATKAQADTSKTKIKLQADAMMEQIRADAARQNDEREAALKEWMGRMESMRKAEADQMKAILDFVSKIKTAEIQAEAKSKTQKAEA